MSVCCLGQTPLTTYGQNKGGPSTGNRALNRAEKYYTMKFMAHDPTNKSADNQGLRIVSKTSHNFKDLTNQRFGKLIAVSFERKKRRTYWTCQCDCGNTSLVYGPSLTAGLSTSCGCNRRTHGMTGTPTKRSYDSMINRCYYPSQINYERYGGRGIIVCDRWRHSFENFLADMGERPKGTTLDRIKNSGNYEPDNCRWATRPQQDANKGPN